MNWKLSITFIKPDPDSKVAPAWFHMSTGSEVRFWRQSGTGLVGSKDKRETWFSFPQYPPIIMMKWVGEIGVRSCKRRVKQSSFIAKQHICLYTNNVGRFYAYTKSAIISTINLHRCLCNQVWADVWQHCLLKGVNWRIQTWRVQSTPVTLGNHISMCYSVIPG